MTFDRQRRARAIVALVMLVASSMACHSSGESLFDYAPYGLDRVPPYWACATATPPPTSTKAPCACVCDGSPGVDECDGEAGLCDGPGEHWRLACAPWPPTPRPTPTPFVMVGGPFWLHQRIWIPIRPTVAPMPAAGDTPAPPAAGRVAIILKSWADHPGHRFDFEVRNASASPIDFDLPAQVFVRCGGNRLIHVERRHYAEHGIDYPDSRLEAGETRDISVSIWYDGPCPDPVLGIFASPYLSRVGSQGLSADAVTGADTALYIDYHAKVPGECSATQEAPRGDPYPEVEVAPAEPERENYAYANLMGGAAAGHRADKVPVTVPPCLGITRGFGCHAFPTGVSGGDRCPPDAPYWHTGVDYSCPAGVPVQTPMGGALVHSSGTGYGKLARIILSERGQTVQMYFAHLSAFHQSNVCHRGGICHAGSRVGATGSTGFSTGPHLHWELRVNDVPVDPFQYYGGSARRSPPGTGAHRPAHGTGGPHQGPGVLGAPAEFALPDHSAATARPPRRYPLTLRMRTVGGAGLPGVEVLLRNIDGGDQAGACVSDSLGRCRLDLPAGVYRIRLAGRVDGHPVHGVGVGNLAAMESGRAEYPYGPLSLWHDAPHSTVGLVLEEDEWGVLQPQIDADPTAKVPRPVDPVDALPEAGDAAGGSDRAGEAIPPEESPGGRVNREMVVGVAFAAALGLLVFVYCASRRIKRRRRRRRWTDG